MAKSQRRAVLEHCMIPEPGEWGMMRLNVKRNPALTRWTRVWHNGKEVTDIAFDAKVPKLRLIPWMGSVDVYVKENGEFVTSEAGDWELLCEHRPGIVWWDWVDEGK